MKRNKATSPYPRTNYLLWELKLHGDVEENHRGGNATQVLYNRVMEHGGREAFRTLQEFRSTMNNARIQKKINTISEGNRTYVIRLQTPDEKMPENPYPETVAAAEIVPYKPLAGVSDEWRNLPITQRLQLLNEISESVHEDMKRFKNGLVDGL